MKAGRAAWWTPGTPFRGIWFHRPLGGLFPSPDPCPLHGAHRPPDRESRFGVAPRCPVFATCGRSWRDFHAWVVPKPTPRWI